MILFFVTLIFSFARGAIALVGVFVLLFARRNKSYRKPLLLLFGFIVVLLIGVSMVGKLDIPMFGNYKISITKPRLLQDGRFEYWRQALVATRERPWFGSGPGTFSLESRRLQARPGSYSWFAHSFPLEILVETGVVGFVLFVTVGWMIIKICEAKKKIKVFYGQSDSRFSTLFEFNLSYISIFLFCIIFGLNSRNKRI